jgi:hypothetical protein
VAGRSTRSLVIMQVAADQPMSPEESWDNGRLYFVQALLVLAEEAPEQCRVMGNFNVPWELKDDVLAGEFLLNSPVSRFSENQRGLLNDLFRELRALPSDAVNQPNTAEGNLRGMSHIAWANLRVRAKELLVELKGKHDH